MPFDKGMSGNPEGRPKGTINKTSLQLRETINNFLQNNFEKIVQDFAILKPNERVRFYCDLLQYGLPKLQTVHMETDFDRLTDEQIDTIIQELKTTSNDKK